MSGTPQPRLALSIIVPVFNEEGNVAPLVDSVRRALGAGSDWELLLVDDGSQDRTVAIAIELVAVDSRVRLIRLARNYGQTPAMQAGFDHARGSVVVSMDGDLQNDPDDIPRIVAKLREGYDLVAGIRQHRQDTFLTRRVPSIVANTVIRWITGVEIHDNGCSLKAYRRELLDRLHLYSDMHRFIPALAASTAGARIAEIPVQHHARRSGRSKYGLSRIGKVMADLLTILMIRSFREQPLTMFAGGALISLLLGVSFTAAAALAVSRVQPGVAEAYVFPAAALLWVGLAFYLLMLGLIAEVLLREHRGAHQEHVPIVQEILP